MSPTPSRRAATWGALLLAAAASVATSPATWSVWAEAPLGTVTLSPDAPILEVSGQLSGNRDLLQSDAHTFDINVALWGDNTSAESGLLRIYAVDETWDPSLPLPDEALIGSQTIRGALGNEEATFSASGSALLDSLSDFHLVLVLEGDAELTGDLTLSANAYGGSLAKESNPVLKIEVDP